MKTPEDIYFKKLVTYRYCRRELQFRVSQALFSSQQIDIGTQFLIRHITPGCSLKYKKILDMGCGYGALGLTLKAMSPESEVHLADSDALAVEYTRQNAEINGLDVKVYGSLDYESVKDNDFDLIISNIPGKAGQPVIEHMMKQAFFHLAPGGEAAIVVVTPLEAACAEIIEKAGNIRLIECKSRPGHVIFHYSFTAHHGGVIPPRRGIMDNDSYFRGSNKFTAGAFTYTAETAYGLPEFDQYSYTTRLLLEGLQGLKKMPVRLAMVFNTQAGHLPVIIRKMFKPENFILVDRDLLALRYSAKNLMLQGLPADYLITSHRAGIDGGGDKVDLAVALLREDEGGEAAIEDIRQLGNIIKGDGVVLVAASSTAVTRIAEKLHSFTRLRVTERKKYRGYSLLVMEPLKTLNSKS